MSFFSLVMENLKKHVCSLIAVILFDGEIIDVEVNGNCARLVLAWP